MGDFHDPAGKAAPLRRIVDAKRDILGNRQGLEKGEVLKHHADAELAGMSGIGDAQRVAPPDNLALVGLLDAIDDFNQGTFARAILTQQGMDITRPNAEIDRIIGEATGELLADPRQSQQGAGSWRRRQRIYLSR
jgi:hypothetical protein